MTNEENAALLVANLRGLVDAAAALRIDLRDAELEKLLLAVLPKLTLVLLRTRVVELPGVALQPAFDSSTRVPIAEAIGQLQQAWAAYQAAVPRTASDGGVR